MMDKIKGIAVKIAARRLITLGEAFLARAITIAPTTGRKIMVVR